jgi:hypothetical protein
MAHMPGDDTALALPGKPGEERSGEVPVVQGILLFCDIRKKRRRKEKKDAHYFKLCRIPPRGLGRSGQILLPLQGSAVMLQSVVSANDMQQLGGVGAVVGRTQTAGVYDWVEGIPGGQERITLGRFCPLGTRRLRVCVSCVCYVRYM